MSSFTTKSTNLPTANPPIAALQTGARQQRMVRAFILSVGLFVFLCFALADPLLRGYRKRDFRDARPQMGLATIAMIVLPQANFEGDTKNDSVGFVNVRFQNHLYKVNQVKYINQLHVDQPAQIVYRVGKSGAIVVDAAEPLPEKVQLQHPH